MVIGVWGIIRQDRDRTSGPNRTGHWVRKGIHACSESFALTNGRPSSAPVLILAACPTSSDSSGEEVQGEGEIRTRKKGTKEYPIIQHLAVQAAAVLLYTKLGRRGEKRRGGDNSVYL